MWRWILIALPNLVVTIILFFFRTRVFISDATLLTNKDAVNIAKEMVNQKRFFRKFAKPMKNLGGIQVLTGNSGEIRVKCSMVNSN
ncbi:hypothetical protein Ahy_A02g006022 [Arachis hypogaea]|uniref:Plant heme peroxidase family profile domain-containing protein n=1 Tax=Arachis hypogaea TaxID=3818 RepID=A0A445E8K9_ARAHY|nr:hypothetical protein Ahy_A02g006022 [Arachis hypogaea]